MKKECCPGVDSHTDLCSWTSCYKERDILVELLRATERKLYDIKIKLDQKEFSYTNVFERWNNSLLREQTLEARLSDAEMERDEYKRQCATSAEAIIQLRPKFQLLIDALNRIANHKSFEHGHWYEKIAREALANIKENSK